MSHFEPFPNQNQVICSDEQFLMSRGLPVRKWPSDLFKCNAAHAEIMTEDDPVWPPPLQFRCTIIGLRQLTPKSRPERACVGMGSWMPPCGINPVFARSGRGWHGMTHGRCIPLHGCRPDHCGRQWAQPGTRDAGCRLPLWPALLCERHSKAGHMGASYLAKALQNTPRGGAVQIRMLCSEEPVLTQINAHIGMRAPDATSVEKEKDDRKIGVSRQDLQDAARQHRPST